MARLSASPAANYLEINGWKVFAHSLFVDQVSALVREVEKLRAANPRDYRQKRETKILAAIVKVAFEVIPGHPAERIFNQGNTLGSDHRHWRRAKFFAGRYRLFFRYSTNPKVIVLAWVNDEETLRTYGSKKDAYAVFRSMLSRGNPPANWNALLKSAEKELRTAGLPKVSGG